jgi:peptide/nickel transport system substrate-binding protein
MVASACGDDSDDATTGGATSSPGGVTTTLTPKPGGTLVHVGIIEPNSLDPIVNSGSSTTGGIEMQAVYDTIMRFDPDTKKYEPHTAESLTPNAEFNEWTLKLRPNIKFTDGTAYNAAAVKWSFDRVMSAANATTSRAYLAPNLKSVTVVDDLTVKFTLNDKWPTFPVVLASEPGMVPSPTAFQQACGETAPRTCSFGLKPVGAGPFMVEEFKPKESLIMARNPNYYAGAPYLEKVSFRYFNANADQSYENFKTGSATAALVRDPKAYATAKKDGAKGFVQPEQSSITMLINNGVSVMCKGGQPASCAGKPDGPYVPPTPTKDLKVRQAVAAALDMKQIDQRISGGVGRPANQLFQPDFAYYAGIEPTPYDPALARRLVSEAKAAGWDGKIRYTCSTNPVEQERGLAIQAMLQSVGMTVQLDTNIDSTTYVQNIIVNKDYDLACWGMAMFNDDRIYTNTLLGNLASTAGRNGYNNPAMDAAITAVRRAATDDEKRAAYKSVAELFKNDIPSLVFVAYDIFYATNPKLHGIYFNHAFMMYFDKAWLEQ